MSHNLVITAMGSDRPGIVNELTKHISSTGCNIVDSRLAIFGSEFTLIMMLSGSWNAITQVESSLAIQGQELELITMMKRTSPHKTINYAHSGQAQIKINDRPGIIEQYTQFFADNALSLVAIKSETEHSAGQEMLLAHFSFYVPAEHNIQTIKKQFSTLCAELDANFTLVFTESPTQENL